MTQTEALEALRRWTKAYGRPTTRSAGANSRTRDGTDYQWVWQVKASPVTAEFSVKHILYCLEVLGCPSRAWMYLGKSYTRIYKHSEAKRRPSMKGRWYKREYRVGQVTLSHIQSVAWLAHQVLPTGSDRKDRMLGAAIDIAGRRNFASSARRKWHPLLVHPEPHLARSSTL